MTIWIVMRNKKVDEVFDNEEAANTHRDNLNNLWAITEVVEKEVKTI